MNKKWQLYSWKSQLSLLNQIGNVQRRSNVSILLQHMLIVHTNNALHPYKVIEKWMKYFSIEFLYEQHFKESTACKVQVHTPNISHFSPLNTWDIHIRICSMCILHSSTGQQRGSSWLHAFHSYNLHLMNRDNMGWIWRQAE